MRPNQTLLFESYNRFAQWKERQIFEAKSQDYPELDIVKEDIERAIALIMGKFPFFGAFIYRFRILYVSATDKQIKTMATDGRNIFINPVFARSLTDAQTVFVLCHEVLHNVMMHFVREKSHNVTNHKKWNYAADYEINPMLVDEGLLSKDELLNKLKGLYADEYLDMTAEEIYDLLPPKPKMPDLPEWLKEKIKDAQKNMPQPESGDEDEDEDEDEQQRDGKNDPKDTSYDDDEEDSSSGSNSQGIDSTGEGIGGILDEEASAAKQKELGVPVEIGTQKDAEKMIEEAIKEKSKLSGGSNRGTGAGLLARAIDRFSKPQVDWKSELRKIIGKMVSRNEEYFGKRKYLHRDEYIYGERPQTNALKDAIMAVDTSGSIGDDELKVMLGEIAGIIRAKKIHKTEIVYFDAIIQGHDVVKNPPNFDWTKATGGGGTSFIPPIEYIEQQNKRGKMELCVFCTDGFGDQNRLNQNPKFAHKFIWLIIDNPGWKPPYGKVVYVSTKKGKGK